jgi:serine/threonine protein phosphatase 1
MKKITYVLSDIHGMYDKLTRIIEKIKDDTATRGLYQEDCRIIVLGDMIDRGPNSKEVLKFLMHPIGGYDVVVLKGNHEVMAIDAHEGKYDSRRLWMMNGGGTCLDSYGHGVKVIPDRHLRWIKSLPYFYEDDLRFYVHAGVDPRMGDPFKQLDVETAVWVRGVFLLHKKKFKKYVVHGHTPCEPVAEVKILDNRCNVDTGCCFSDKYPLSCAVFDDKQEKPIGIIRSFDK